MIFLTERRAFERGHSARDPALPEARRLALRTVLDPKSGEAIDRGLVVWFEAPNTETGETMAELHLHGGRAVVGGALEAIGKLGFCRLAEPGEFTRRAFEHGKLDLTQAEAIADLVAAETDQQRKLALQQMDGALHRLYEDWRTLGLRALAHLEAAIDFPDEDLPPGIADEVRAGITQLQAEIAAHLDDRRGERLRQGISIAIIGPPNAGKSSLLNLLARREAAIVSEIAGTTRDVIEVHVDLGGWPVVLADTAGLRASGDAIEQEGVRRAQARAASADLRLLVLDAVGDWKSEMKAFSRDGRTLGSGHRHRGGEQGRSCAGQGRRCGAAVGDLGDRPARAAEAAGTVGRGADAGGRRCAAAHPRAPSRGASGMPGLARPCARRAGDCAGGGRPSAGAAGARPHHRHGADRRAAGRHLPRLLHREVTPGGWDLGGSRLTQTRPQPPGHRALSGPGMCCPA